MPEIIIYPHYCKLGFLYYLRTLVKSCRNMTESGAVRPGLTDQLYSLHSTHVPGTLKIRY